MLKKILAIAFSLTFLIGVFSFNVSASENTTYTYTISVDDEWIRTQDAYMASEIIFKDYDLSQPSDIFINGRNLYVADSGNSRIVIYNLDTKEKTFIGESILSQPSGVFAKNDGTVYVADMGLKEVLVFNVDGSLKLKIVRPNESPLFSKSATFEPKNVVVTSQDNIFVVGTGSHEGIMQFGSDGEFQGFFAANKRHLSLIERIQELLFTDEQKEQLLNRTSRPIENIDVTDRDLLCTVTQDAGVTTEWREATAKIENRIKIHNMAGVNILAASEDIHDEWNFVDVASGKDGFTYTLSYTGVISEYDSQGNLLFSFGGRSMSTDRNGLFTVAAAIDLDDNGFIYVLDKERGIVQVFYPTEYAALTHEATKILNKGDYEESEKIWKSILNLNGMSRVAHIGYGKSLMHQGNFKAALNEFKIANDKENYSDAFWEIRNEIINSILPYLLISLVVLFAVVYVYKAIAKKKGFKLIKKREIKSRLIKDILNVFDMLKHPIDNFYDLKVGTKGSVLSAAVIYIAVTLVFVVDTLFRGYLFAPENLSDLSIFPVLIMFIVPLGLFIVGNSMVASINDGEGSFKNIFVITAYSLSPYLIITPFVVIASYGVTFNESFILDLIWFVGVAWSAVILFIGIMRTHDYNFGETVKNILITVFFMLMAVVAAAIMYVMWNALISFIKSVLVEVDFRVTG
ncbi:MAG: hypothetical protein E7545_01665 [Ruminococcaceae bacterium]|nr:hypothetical protein [Oscillospiraceae bacterium]